MRWIKNQLGKDTDTEVRKKFIDVLSSLAFYKTK